MLMKFPLGLFKLVYYCHSYSDLNSAVKIQELCEEYLKNNIDSYTSDENEPDSWKKRVYFTPNIERIIIAGYHLVNAYEWNTLKNEDIDHV
jgi:hypothetical protein